MGVRTARTKNGKLRRVHRSAQGVTLVELLISTALSMLLLLALLSYLSHVVNSERMQEDSNTLYHQAQFISQLWQKSFAYAGDLGCRPFEQQAQITSILNGQIITHAGIAIYQVGSDFLPQELSHVIQKKLLPHSVVVVTEGIQMPTVIATYATQTGQFSLSQAAFQEGDWVLLSNCHHAWLFQWDHTARKNFTAPFSIQEPDLPYQLALWQTTFWFAMRNNQNRYGIYRLILPNETTPVELISDISAFQAKVWLHDQMIPATVNIDWQQIKWIQLLLTLEKNHLRIQWPTSIALLRKAQSWQTA